ncbi:MAG TPA: caspase family protein [Blastocatellia bacterium]|nr:caspase family protein [Blastocatellia bacterium]
MKLIRKAIDRTLDCLKVGALLFFCLCSADAQSGSSAASPKASDATPKKFALVIGIDKYETAPLLGCVKDAEKFRDALINQSGFRPENITMLTDEAATYKGILQAIVEHRQKAQKGDLFVLYFSGHGTLFPDEQSADRDEKTDIEPPNLIPGKYDGAICPIDIDSEVNSSGKPWENLVLDDTLAWHFSRFTSKGCTVIFISDSCHSGAQARDTRGEIISKKLNLMKALRSLRSADGGDNDDLRPEQIKQKLQNIPPPAISREVESYNLRGQYLLFASSRDIQESGATKTGSLFTNALLDVMRERPKATFKEIYEDVAARVKQTSMAKDRLQEPRLDRRYYKSSLDVPFLSLPPTPEESRSTTLKASVKVINEKGQAIKLARVTLLPMSGKIPVATGSTSINGVYETKTLLKAGDYRLRVEGAGYVKVEDQIELIEGSQIGKASFTVRLKKP